MSTERAFARLLRFVTVVSLLNKGLIDRIQAEDILAGELSPGDVSTTVDDSALLDEDYGQALVMIRKSEEFDATGEENV